MTHFPSAVRARAPLLAALVVAVGCEGAGDVVAVHCLGGVWVAGVVYGLGTVVIALLGAMLTSALRWARLARAANRSAHGGTTLREGPSVLVGRVGAGTEPAVRLEIHQQGHEEKGSSGDWIHRWVEKERRIRVRPFELELASGERVRVEPTERVYLADALDGLVRINRAARVLVAELTPGESVIAVGQLERRARPDGYRGTADRWALVPPRRGEPMILSTEPLGARFSRRARGALAAVVLSVLASATVHALSSGYHLRAWKGSTVLGSYVDDAQWTTESDDGTVVHHSLTVRLPDESLHTEEIDRVAQQTHAWVRWVPSHPRATSFGRTATLHRMLLSLHIVLPFLVLLAYVVLTRKAWYEGARQRSSGPGRL
ncbi:MAG: hypothetical protein IT378_07935 [Sandaracinaceae bacterium]|nr:hypothetical protein [Sandaracinaceae bacterium]